MQRGAAVKSDQRLMKRHSSMKLCRAQGIFTREIKIMVGKFNVLVVDDEPDKRMLLKVALETEGYQRRRGRSQRSRIISTRFYNYGRDDAEAGWL